MCQEKGEESEIPPATSQGKTTPETAQSKEDKEVSEERTVDDGVALSEEKSTGSDNRGTLNERGVLSEERSASEDGALSEDRSVSEEVEEHRTVVQLEEVMSGDDKEEVKMTESAAEQVSSEMEAVPLHKLLAFHDVHWRHS